MAGPYFPPLEVAGQMLAFDHLEPFVLEMATQSRPNGVKIDVRFSNHCFCETFDAARHDETAVTVWDGPRRRVFCPIRYGLSQALPHIRENRMAVRFVYEWRDDAGHWFRSYGNELWSFDAEGLMEQRHASINDCPIHEDERLFCWDMSGPRPADHPGLTELGL